MFRRKRQPFIESLEPRRLLAAQPPIASNDSYTILEDNSLVPRADESSLILNNTNYSYGYQNFTTTNLPADNRVAVLFSSQPNSGAEWAFGFGTSDGSQLGPGHFDNASNLSGSHPFLNILSQTRLYNNTISGQFDILQAQYNPDSSPARFAASFSAQTDTGNVLVGTVKYHYSTSVLMNDSDPSGLPLSAILVSPTAHGQLNLTPDGLFSYTPDLNYNGTDTFTYVATDGASTSAPATVTIQIAPVNDPPTFTKGPDITVKQNAGTVTIPHWAKDMSPGPADEAGQTLRFTVVSDDYNWSNLLSNLPTLDPVTGDLTFTVSGNSYGSATFVIDLFDTGGRDNGGQDFNEQMFNINVLPVPKASDDYFSTMQNQPLVLGDQAPQNYLWVYSDPTDVAGDHQVHYLTSSTGYFSSYFSSDANVDYNSTANGVPDCILHFYQQQLGLHTITSSTDPNNLAFQISQQQGPNITSATGEFFIDQGPQQSPNSLAVDFQQHANGSTGTLYGVLRYNYVQPASVLSNDETSAGITPTATLTTNPAHGQITFNPDGSFTYTPTKDFVGIDTFTYTESFNGDTSAPATVTIHVSPSLPVTAIKGEAENVYSTSDGSHVTTPLADRVVFDDLNNNGLLDPNEPSSTTDLTGNYSLPVFAGTSIIRLQELPGWSPPAGYSDFAQITASSTSAPADTPLYTAMTHPVVINVAAIYSQEFSGSFNDPATEVANAFLEANRVYANSDTNILLNLIDTRPTNYSESLSLNTDLTRMYYTTDGYMDELPAIRQATQADIQILFRANPETKLGGETIGLSYIFNPAHPDPSVALGVVVSNDGDTLAHEIGHILGAGHDPANNSNPTTSYAYGYTFTGNDGVLYRDVMAYSQTSSQTQVQLPFFSTPKFSYAGSPLGVTNQADNARVVRENGPIVAAYEAPTTSSDPGGGNGANGNGNSNNGNNSGNGSSGNTQPLPLTPLSLTGPKSAVKPGATLTLSLKFLNSAGAPYTGNLTIEYYLSPNATFDTTDISLKIANLSVKKLKSKHSVFTSLKFKLSKTITPGTYYVFAVINGQAPDATTTAAITVATPPKKKH